MCGRYSLATSAVRLKKQFKALKVDGTLTARYNIAPTQAAHVFTGERLDHLRPLHWGLLPHWASSPQPSGALINARSEGIATRPSFRLPIRRGRCVVPADSFYEWRSFGRERWPYRILRADEGLLLFAGICDVWEGEGRRIETFAIITAPANADMAPLHERMPVILPDAEAAAHWLQAELPLAEALAMLRPAPDNTLRHYRVSQELNAAGPDHSGLHLPLPPLPEQGSLF